MWSVLENVLCALGKKAYLFMWTGMFYRFVMSTEFFVLFKASVSLFYPVVLSIVESVY